MFVEMEFNQQWKKITFQGYEIQQGLSWEMATDVLGWIFWTWGYCMTGWWYIPCARRDPRAVRRPTFWSSNENQNEGP